MKLIDAIEKASPGDKLGRIKSNLEPWFEIVEIASGSIEVKMIGSGKSLYKDHYIADDWEIIGAEPEILTVEELVNKNNWESLHHSVLALNDMIRRDLRDLSEMADKNGQNKEWNRLQPLVDAAGFDILEVIKPPWECGK